ncbi:BED-type domain-containing protein [Aphis craccivora]|uniref:BED-type domain-containing protein n=1 Tax=Aphis craccivora TaxID=307492 RepID=A0A6G0VUI0_APHCR|nr:BED-type domain-containing protein [Aphis craccivora]
MFVGIKCIAFLNNGDVTHTAGELVVAKSRGLLVHPNGYFDLDVFEKVISDITMNINFKFSCSLHLVEVTTELIVYYIQMRMRQYSYQENLKCKKLSREKKKQSKLCNT